jgi:sarcosine oxidase subunit alpha
MPSRKVTFYYGNRRLQGVEGEPIAKALFAAGIRTLSYSVKYKRPRSIHCARGRCVTCHMEVNGTPGVPTCITPLEEGMRIRAESWQPFFAPLLTWAARLIPFPAGFYYRKFTRPALLRRFFLGTLRRMAGVGRVTLDEAQHKPLPPIVPAVGDIKNRYDVVVVGAGLSGMAAALSAAANGVQVLLVDEYRNIGGHSNGYQSDKEMAAQRERLARKLMNHDAIRQCPGTSGLGFYPPDTLLVGPTAGGGDTFMKRVSARSFVFATGAYDLLPLFANNDLPGIFGARAIRLLLERDGLTPGRRAVVYGSGATLDEIAALLAKRGIEIAAVVNAGPGTPEASAAEKAVGDAARFRSARVQSVRGKKWLSSVQVTPRDDGLGAGFRSETISCDLLCTAFPGQPAYELPYQAGFTFELREEAIVEDRVLLPREREMATGGNTHCFIVGEVAGDESWRDKIAAGDEAGKKASGSLETEQRGLS